ncbi:hypothetical protein AX15_004199 [Amanita polypyramis BW_CC]|nr:hypothetical protein AX15_004199 [Amanita polypyramis BW_CC]
MSTTGTETSQQAAHHVRITTNGKIKSYVSFALKWFDENEDTPIVFHTLPHAFLAPPEKRERNEPAANENDTKQRASATTTQQPPSTKSVTSMVPRLISVIEIIKREFLRNLAIHHSPRLAGLHQYTEIGCLEDLQKPDVEAPLPPGDKQDGSEGLDERAMEVVEALSGKNHVKKRRTPYMKVTLSLNSIPALEQQGASYQRPTIRHISKSAKSRAKKRARKRQEAEDSAVEADTNAQEMPE